MENFILFGSIAAAVLLIVALLLCMYVKAPPSVAFILSGLRKEPRVLIGTGGFKVPIIERLDKMFLGQVTVDVKTSLPVPTPISRTDLLLFSCICSMNAEPSHLFI